MCAFFFWYFLYVGTHSPYLSLYLSEAGLSVAQIGLILSIAPATRLVGPLFWGALADRAGWRLAVMRSCALIALLALIVMAFSAGSFVWILVCATLMFFANAGQVPIGEAIALQASGGEPGRYARMRVWGSVGFIVGVLAMAPVLKTFGTLTLPGWLAGMMLALIAATWGIPGAELRPVPPAADVCPPARSPVWRAVRQPPIAAFFVSAFLMIYAHAAFYAFFSLFLERQGFDKLAIGALWALGVVAEIGIFFAARPLFARFAALTLLSFSLAVAALRFVLVGLSDGSVVILAFTQLLHAVTFGLHHSATQALLQRWFDPGQQARAQGLHSTIAYGLGGTLGGLGASALWIHVSPEAAFIGAGLAAALGGLAALFCVRWAGLGRTRL